MTNKKELSELGFTIIDNIYTDKEIENIFSAIDNADSTNATFRKSADLFAIRQFLKEIPEATSLIFNNNFKKVIEQLLGNDYFVVKSIYFDKPEQSNWFVAYHQDLTISVDKKVSLDDFSSWTVKQGQFSVQPPVSILKKIYTVRIHLDNTDEHNGALKVVPGSHLKDIYRPETVDWSRETETICQVPKGGLMIMRPLLLHCSSRTTNGHQRRVIHIEFSNQELPTAIQWAERQNNIHLSSAI